MSDNQSRRADDFAKYEAMTTKELEKILRLDSNAPEGQELGEEELLLAMEVSAHRKRNSENPGKTAQQAWESFEEHYLPATEETTTQKKKERPHLWRWIAAAVAAALIVTVPLSARALRWDNVWSSIAQWANGTFSFISVGDPKPTEPPIQGNLGYDAFLH